MRIIKIIKETLTIFGLIAIFGLLWLSAWAWAFLWILGRFQ
jgi:hypothetical protein